MLSIFKTPEDRTFAVWVVDRPSDIGVIVCDGVRVWRTAERITAAAKPISRIHESDEDFLNQLKKSLRTDSLGLTNEFEVEFQTGEDGLKLTVKETIGSTSTKSILFKTTLPIVDSPQEGIMNMLAQIAGKFQRDNLQAIEQNKSLMECTALVETLTANTREMATMKDKLQDEMTSKMCMILNCKKREIERLQQRVTELESINPNAPPAFIAAESPPKLPLRKRATPTKATKPSKPSTRGQKHQAKSGGARKTRLESESEEEEIENEPDLIDCISSQSEESRVGMTVPVVTQTSLGGPFSLNSVSKGSAPAEAPNLSQGGTDSDEDLLPSKRRKASQQQNSSSSSAPVMTAKHPVPHIPSTASQRSVSGPSSGKVGTLSKFYAEDSDEESENCLAFMS